MPLIAEAVRQECRWCHAEVVWCYDDLRRRRVPVNPRPDGEGICVQTIREGHHHPGVRFLSGEERVSWQGVRYAPHLRTCAAREDALAELRVRDAG